MFRRRPHSDFSAELESHLAHEQDRLQAEGLSPEAARQQARKNLGNLLAAEERFYEAARPMWLDQALQDIRLTFRQIRMAPAFAATVTLTLALGIGLTTSTFTLIHAVMLKSLPVADPARLYRLGNVPHCCVWGGYSQNDEFSIVATELYQHLQANTKGFEELAAFQAGQTKLGVRRAGSAAPADTEESEFVSGNYFRMFGLNAYAGRLLVPTDDQPSASPVAVMSYATWQQKFGLDPSVVGAVFHLNDKPFTIVGIAPPGFFGDTLRATPPAFYLPIGAEPLIRGDASFAHQTNRHWLDIIGRIQPGADPRTIEAQMRVELRTWLQSHLADMSPNDRSRLDKQTLFLTPGGAGITSLRRDYEQWLRILLMVSGFVLLIVCANVANLLLVRGMERRQQTSLSMALGARAGRLIRQALTESLVLSLLGGAAGVAVAFVGTRVLIAYAFPDSGSFPVSAAPSLPVLGFALALTLVTGLLFGLAPAWMALRADPIEALRGASRATRHSGGLPRRVLVVLQAALSLTLLCGAGLLTATLRNIENRDLGFRQDNRTVVYLDASLAGYKPAQLDTLYRNVHDTLAAIPGVKSVALALYSPLSGDSWNDLVFFSGRAAPGPNEQNVAWCNRVTAGYFETLGNAIVKGRAITAQDTASSRHIAVVNEAFARQFFKDEDPIGKHFGSGELAMAAEYEIVGVAQDSRIVPRNPNNAPLPFYFLPDTQHAVYHDEANKVGEIRSHYLHDIVIERHPGATVTEDQIRRAVASIDSNLPVIRTLPLREQVAANFTQQRLIARLTAIFGGLALLLAAIGIYGVTAFTVGSRTTEIGLRMALGADRPALIRLILRGAMALIVVGLMAGVPLTLWAGQLLTRQLYGLTPNDPLTILGAAAALGGAGFLAALIPAVRASGLNPIQALRAE